MDVQKSKTSMPVQSNDDDQGFEAHMRDIDCEAWTLTTSQCKARQTPRALLPPLDARGTHSDCQL